MNKTPHSRFSATGFAIGLGSGVARSAALGAGPGLPLGVGLAVVFGLKAERKC